MLGDNTNRPVIQEGSLNIQGTSVSGADKVMIINGRRLCQWLCVNYKSLINKLLINLYTYGSFNSLFNPYLYIDRCFFTLYNFTLILIKGYSVIDNFGQFYGSLTNSVKIYLQEDGGGWDYKLYFCTLCILDKGQLSTNYKFQFRRNKRK